MQQWVLGASLSEQEGFCWPQLEQSLISKSFGFHGIPQLHGLIAQLHGRILHLILVQPFSCN